MNNITKLARFLLLAVSLAFSSAPRSVLAETISTETDTYSEAQLEQLLAPVALYPDSLLSHILIAATYPLEVVQAARWCRENRDLTGEEALQAAASENWDPSVQALVAFPQLLDKMSEDLEWTQRLGEAFLLQEEQVLAGVQSLRKQADAVGSLKDLKHVDIERKREAIVIEPAVKEVVYVPYYDTRVVYGDWRWHRHPPVFWDMAGFHVRLRGGSGPNIHWSTGVHIPSRFYFSNFHWARRHLVVINLDHFDRPPIHFGRDIVRHRDAHRWHHNPAHRRGVHYRHHRLQRDWGHNRRGDNRRYDDRRRLGPHITTRPGGRSSWRTDRERWIHHRRAQEQHRRNHNAHRDRAEHDRLPPGVVRQGADPHPYKRARSSEVQRRTPGRAAPERARQHDRRHHGAQRSGGSQRQHPAR